MRKVVQRICFVAAALLGATATAVATEIDRRSSASILDDDMKARRRKLTLQHPAEPTEEDIATLHRLLSRQVLRIEENKNVQNSINRRSLSASSGNAQRNLNSNNPLSRAVQRSLTRGSSSSSNNKRSRRQQRRRTPGSGFGRNGGSFVSGSNQLSDIELPAATAEQEEESGVEMEEPVAVMAQEESMVSDTELVAEDTSSVAGTGQEQETEVQVDTTRKGSRKNGHKAGKASYYDE